MLQKSINSKFYTWSNKPNILNNYSRSTRWIWDGRQPTRVGYNYLTSNQRNTDLTKLNHTCVNCVGVTFHVMWQSQCKHNGKPNDEQVSGGIHVSKLKIGDSNSCDHSKHDHEYSTNNWIWNADEQCTNLANNTNNHHDKGTKLNDTKTTNLTKGNKKCLHSKDEFRILYLQLITSYFSCRRQVTQHIVPKSYKTTLVCQIAFF